MLPLTDICIIVTNEAEQWQTFWGDNIISKHSVQPDPARVLKYFPDPNFEIAIFPDESVFRISGPDLSVFGSGIEL
jgi:hypothetical protein